MPVRHAVRALSERLSHARRLLSLDFSPRLPPWSRLHRPTTPVQRLRAEATRIGPLASRHPVARLTFGAAAVFWQLRAPWEALVGAARHGAGIREAGGPSRLTQFRNALGAAYAWNVAPRNYFALRLWKRASDLSAETVVQDAEIGLHQMVANRGLDVGAVADKDRFAALCRSHALPVAGTLHVLRGATSDVGVPLPRRSLFVKPIDGAQGLGAQRWLFDGEAGRWVRGAQRLDQPELLSYIDSMRGGRPYLLQECLANHPELERISGPTLSSMRVMTRRSADGTVSSPCVVLKIGRHGAEVDNRHAGGIVCALDPDSGRLAAGFSSLALGPVVEHPDSGVPLDGCVITVHREVVELALRAHRTIAGLPRTVGWDIAATPEGPVIIEANTVWGAGAIQWARQGPLPTVLVETYLPG